MAAQSAGREDRQGTRSATEDASAGSPVANSGAADRGLGSGAGAAGEGVFVGEPTAGSDPAQTSDGAVGELQTAGAAVLAQAGASGAAADAGVAGARADQPGASVPEPSARFPTFTRHDIASIQSGYHTVVADIDGDGLLDVVGLSSGAPGLKWFKNPTWESYRVTSGTERFICSAAYDVDGDGDTDLAFASEFDLNDSEHGGTIYWAEAPSNPTTDEEWGLHLVDAVPTSHRVFFADIDGDGRKALINLPIFGVGSSGPEHVGPVQLSAYEIPQEPAAAWSARILNDSLLEVAHGLSVVDWDGDGADDLLSAANDGVDLFRPSLGTEPLHLGDGAEGARPDRGSSEVALGNLLGAPFVATIEPWHGTDTVIYTPGASGAAPWQRRVLGSDFQHGHALVAADLDGDGYDELIGGGAQGTRALLIYRYQATADAWATVELDIGGVAVSSLAIADLNNDGALDIVAIGRNPTNHLVWYESMPQWSSR